MNVLVHRWWTPEEWALREAVAAYLSAVGEERSS